MSILMKWGLGDKADTYMSTTCVTMALTICFAVLSTLTFTQGSISLDFRQDGASKMFEVDDAEAIRSDHINARVDRSIDSVDPMRSFLAGEDTPVWIAYYADPHDKVMLTYEKLEKGIVKQAIDYWKSYDFGTISKRKRSVDDNMHLLKGDRESFAEPEDMNNARPKRETNVYHPSVLAVMEYEGTWPSDKNVILRRIVYALAYWNSISIQLRPIENPWVRLRLAGIVMGRDRDATHHVLETYDGENYLNYEKTLQSMGEYWGDQMRQTVDFQRGTYNIVALMTDSKQAPDKTSVSVSSDGSPCNPDKPGATAVIITYDNLKFSGLQETLRSTARILGHGSDEDSSCVYKTNWKDRAWGACDLDSIRTSLESKGSCMKDPQEFHNPGNPIEIVLSGSIMSWNEQCKAVRSTMIQICSPLTCHNLRCQNMEFAGMPCVSLSQAAMEGTICGDGKICLNGECVVNTLVTYAWTDSKPSSS